MSKRAIKLVVAMWALAIVSFTAMAEATAGEWVTCPTLDVAAVVTPRLTNKGVECRYYHPKQQTTLLATRVVPAKQTGKKYSSCLADNTDYKKSRSTFANRMYCDYDKTQAELVQSAYAWSTNYNAQRIEFGYRQVQGESREPLGYCRASYKGGKHVGRVWRGSCYFPYEKKEQKVGAGVEYLVLTKPYGIPGEMGITRGVPNNAVVVDPKAPPPLQMRFCKFKIKRGSTLASELGLSKKVELDLPGFMLPGNVCVAAAKGRTRVSNKPNHQLVLY